MSLLDQAGTKTALLVGETIEDVYHYCSPLGRPGKEPVISVLQGASEAFSGGVQAAAKHAKAVCKSVAVLSDTSIRKERWVESAHNRKMFQVYSPWMSIPHALHDPKDYDLTMVLDYGHGMMNVRMLEKVKTARFLAVNVQTNSGNYGYNLATKYDKVGYLVVDELEARLATGNQFGAIESSLRTLALRAEKVIITLGKNGAIGHDKTGTYTCPAFTDRVVDTMGAGDAFFAITAPFAQEASLEELIRIGNAAGALAAQIVGNRSPVSLTDLRNFLVDHQSTAGEARLHHR